MKAPVPAQHRARRHRPDHSSADPETPACPRIKTQAGARAAADPRGAGALPEAGAAGNGRSIRGKRRVLWPAGLRPTYATRRANIDRQLVLNGILLGSAVELAAIPFFGALSDRIGRRPVYLFGAVMTAVIAYPLLAALDRGRPHPLRSP